MNAIGNRKRKTLDKPLCKYGASCYQKNPDHHKKFKHPPEKDKDMNHNSLSTAKVIASGVSGTPVLDKVKIPSGVSGTPVLNKVNLASPSHSVKSNEDTVGEILKSMPQDFIDFWDFCSIINKSDPQDAFSNVGYKLVGVYDLLAKKLPADMKVDILCHWRYFYDPPEFQTVIKKNGKELYHIGYFRDDPSEKPSILASNSAAVDERLTLVGDNIFCAMNLELNSILKTTQFKTTQKEASKLQEELLKFASRKKYSMNRNTSKIKQRQENVVTKSFHGLGIVVPFKNDIGYRPLPDSDAVLRKILKRIVTAENEEKRLEVEENLDEIITNVHFANDECDYGMGLELGIDLFCYGDPYFHKTAESLLTLAYNLLKRPRYASIVKAHLKSRKKGEILKSNL